MMKLLAIGSVIRLNEELFVIAGYQEVRVEDSERKHLYYILIRYPLGFVNPDQIYAYSVEKSFEIVFTGNEIPEFYNKEHEELKMFPVGSVVEMETSGEESTYCMIIGYYPYHEDKRMDYMGVLYPEGLDASGDIHMFNQDSVKNVLIKGYMDDEGYKLLSLIPNFADDMEGLVQELERLKKQVKDGMNKTKQLLDIEMS